MKTLITGLAILIAGGCSILPESQPPAEHDFGYRYPLSENATLIRPPVIVEAPEWLADNRIRYRMLYASPTQVRFYSLDRWIAPPPELFEQLLNSSDKQWPLPVTIRLEVFEQQFEAPGRAQVIMHFTVITARDDNKHKAKKRDFHLQLPCPTPDSKGAVTGFISLTKQAADKIRVWLLETN